MDASNEMRKLVYEDFKARKKFRIEPSRYGGSDKTWDAEQLRIFCRLQKNMSMKWRKMGIVRIYPARNLEEMGWVQEEETS